MRRMMAAVLALALISSSTMAGKVIPANLPKPDGKPGSQKKPVKVYILAGQSNMVGFGRLSGGSPLYSWIYLSADPSVMPRNLGKGKGALLPMRVYQEADGGEQGAKTENGTVVRLGTVAEKLPGSAGQTVVVKGFIEIPMTGTHEVHVGIDDTRYAVATVNGKEVYRRDSGAEAVITKVELESGKRHPITITYSKGGSGSAAFWMKLVDLKSSGDLTTLMNEGKYTWYRDDEGNWTVRNDVIYWDVRTSKEELGDGGPLSATSNGGMLGPEIPFGFVMGEFHDEQVLLIESSMGNRAINFDYRPPSSGKTDEEKENKYCGYEYDWMVEGVHKTLKNLDKVVPGYEGQGYEIVGFVWFQGHKDSGQTKEQYEGHLVNLIKDLRKEFKAPEMKAAVATVAFGGWDLGEGWIGVHAAQMAVGDPEQHPEFKGNVASVDTRGFWRSRVESPTGTGYHYNHNAETYHLVGDSLGRAMVELLGGKAEPTPNNRPKPEVEGTKAIKDMSLAELTELVHSDAFASDYTQGGLKPTREQEAAMGEAMRPIVLDDMLGSYLGSLKPARKGHMSLATVLNGGGPACNPGDGSLQCEYDQVLERYALAGITDYDWKAVDAIPMDAEWNYISFDPPEKQALDKSKRNRKVTPPKGSEEWTAAGFDAKKADWEQGKAPFGQKDGKKIPIMPNCRNPRCGCGKVPNTMWEKETILVQQTFEIPELKDGHMYRLVLGGGHHDRKGEGYEIYVNGKLFATAQGGYFRHNNGARGGYITPEFLPEFKSGKVTIAIKAFLRYTHFNNGTTYFSKADPEYYGKPVPPNGNISLFMEEAELPEPVMKLGTKEDK